MAPKQQNAETEKRRSIKVTDLLQLAPDEVDVRIVVDDHEERVVPMRTLSWAQWEQIGESVPHPIPEPNGVTASGKLTYDYSHPDYLQRVAQANNERAYRRLLAMLRLEVPGSTDAEKVAFLKALDSNFINQLMTAANQLASGGRASIDARAGAFQRGG